MRDGCLPRRHGTTASSRASVVGRAEELPQAIRDIAWKTQLRLSGRFARLRARGVQINKVCVAVARELAGFVWAVASARAGLPQS